MSAAEPQPTEQPVPCPRCGLTKYVDWVLLPHELYNSYMPGGSGHYCFPCFAIIVSESHTNKQELQARIGQVQYLYDLRALYDRYELEHKTDLEGNNIATWQGYKFFRNPISDKIEAITGVRSNEDVERWVVAQLKSPEGGDKCKKSNNQNDN